MEHETISTRLKEAIDASNLSHSALARLFVRHGITMDRSAVSRSANGDRKIGADEAVLFARFLGLNINWLMTGDGPMLSTEPVYELRRLNEHEEYQEDRLMIEHAKGFGDGDYRPSIDGAIPEIDVRVGAGEGAVGEVINIPLGDDTISGHAVVGEWLAPSDYIKHELNISSRQSVVMAVVGDSMSPTYMPGDKVIVDLRCRDLHQDGVYIISDGVSPPQIKRLTRVLFTDPVMVEIVSDNPSHRTQSIELSRLSILGRVAGRVTRQ